MPLRSSSKTGSELFVVDNSADDWKVVRYLHEWCQLSKGIDIATGYFEIGSLLALKDVNNPDALNKPLQYMTL